MGSGFRTGLILALAMAVQPAAAEVPRPRPAIAAPHQRVLPLQGGQNFRDLGGYRTADGRSVRWGLLYRSGSMHGLTPADYRLLERRGIRTVCDFRDTKERASEPVAWPGPAPPRILSEDYAMVVDAVGPGAPGESWTAESARQKFAAMYPKLLVQFNHQYRRMFAELLAGHAPLAFNCTAGKDRTGVAAALLLTALGVPRETVIQDYELSNRTFDPKKLTHKPGQVAPPPTSLPPEVLKAFVAADRSYIEAMFQVVDAHPGGAAGYLRDELGLSRADIAKLRRMYTG